MIMTCLWRWSSVLQDVLVTLELQSERLIWRWNMSLQDLHVRAGISFCGTFKLRRSFILQDLHVALELHYAGCECGVEASFCKTCTWYWSSLQNLHVVVELHSARPACGVGAWSSNSGVQSDKYVW